MPDRRSTCILTVSLPALKTIVEPQADSQAFVVGKMVETFGEHRARVERKQHFPSASPISIWLLRSLSKCRF